MGFSQNRVYDQKSADIIDSYSGEVEERVLDHKPSIRASDYAEWESKRYHEVLVSDKDRKLWSIIWSIGEKIGAPKWLRDEVFWFYKKARVLKTHPMLKSKYLHLNDKCIIAVYYVVAKKRGEYGLADKIASMPCNSLGEPCYVNRKRGDPVFKKYLKIVLRYASVIYPNHGRNPIALIDIVAKKTTTVPETVYRRAKEIAVKLYPYLSGRSPGTVAATCLKLALDEVMPGNSKPVFTYICSVLKVSEASVQNFINHLKKTNAI